MKRKQDRKCLSFGLNCSERMSHIFVDMYTALFDVLTVYAYGTSEIGIKKLRCTSKLIEFYILVICQNFSTMSSLFSPSSPSLSLPRSSLPSPSLPGLLVLIMTGAYLIRYVGSSRRRHPMRVVRVLIILADTKNLSASVWGHPTSTDTP
jgi:hypothetical protein